MKFSYAFKIICLIYSLNIFSQEQIYLVDLIFLKYLPEDVSEENFLVPSLERKDNVIFLSQFPYPEIEISPLPLNLNYEYQDLFLSIKFEDDLDSIESEEDSNLLNLIPTLNKKKSEFEVDSARNFTLSDEVKKIARSRDFRVIGTKSWFQKIQDINNSETVFIDTDFFKGNRIFGYLKLYKERFLHFSSTIYLSEEDPSIQTNPHFIKGKSINNDDLELNIFENKNQILLYEVSQEKKLRSGELHYVDHPKFGMLVKLTKAQRELTSLDNE